MAKTTRVPKQTTKTNAKKKKKPNARARSVVARHAASMIPKDILRREVEGSSFIKAYFELTLGRAIAITNALVRAVANGLALKYKTPNDSAIEEWRYLLFVAVYKRLLSGGDWDADGSHVLAVATDMGGIAGLLAGSKSEASANHLKAAFLASKSHDTCSSAGVGGGAWCTFDWF
jgi:hypothetical protein